VFATIALAVVLATRVGEWRRQPRAVIAAFAIAATVTAVIALPVALPYRRVAIEQNMVRSVENVRQFSATPKGYLAASGRLHSSTWSGRFLRNPVDTFFPGVVAILLGAVALWHTRRTDALSSRATMLIALGVTGFVLSLGVRTPIYGWLFAVFPPMQGLRAAARFGNLFLLTVAILAGDLVDVPRWRFRSRSWRVPRSKRCARRSSTNDSMAFLECTD
jgi:uncharacterized protein (DUF697 family)